MLSKEQKRFIGYELGLLTIKAALSTRDDTYTIYKSTVKTHQRKPVKTAIRKVLKEIETEYDPMLSSEEHIQHISDTADRLTNEVGKYLLNNRFRIGIAQKLINMHLKYLWCSGVVKEPPHCPIDGIIRDKVAIDYPEFDYNWIRSDDIEEYESAVATIQLLASGQNKSIAKWELKEFRRRDDD